jgi:hypothetical protein
MWPWSRNGYCSLSRHRVRRGGALGLRGFGVPGRIYGAITSATGNNFRLAFVNAVIVAIPTYDVAFVYYVAPMRISGLESMARADIKAQSRHRSCEHQHESEYPHA